MAKDHNKFNKPQQGTATCSVFKGTSSKKLGYQSE